MTAGARRRAGQLAVWAAVLMLLSLVTGGVLSPTTAQAATPEPAEIVLAGITPGVVGPTDELQISGVIRNVGDQPISYLTARLHLLRGRLGSRDELDDWTSGELGPGPVVGRTVDLFPPDDPALVPGASVPFTLTVNQAELGLTGAPFGSYGIEVEARGQLDGPRTEVGQLRSALVWSPGGASSSAGFVPQQLALLVPFTGLPAGGQAEDLSLTQVATAVGPGSRLRHVLDSASAPGVGWAVDPALLRTLTEAIGRRGTAPSPVTTTTPTPDSTPSGAATSGGVSSGATAGSASSTPSSSPTTPATTTPDEAARAQITGFLDDMRAAAQGRTVIELPYADPDVQAVAQAGYPQLLLAANALGAGTVQEVLGVPAATDVAWPAEGWADDHTLESLSDDGTTTVVLDSRSRPLTDPLDYTTDSRTQLPGGLTGWLSDGTLSSLVADAQPSDVLQRQQLLTQTASLTTERPGLARRFLLALPRELDPDPAAFHGLLDALAGMPWVSRAAPTDLRYPLERGDTSSLERRSARLPRPVAAAQLTSHDVTAVQQLRSDLSALAEVLASPSQVTGDLQHDTVGLLSSAWRGHPSTLAARQVVVTRHVHALLGELHVLPTRANLLATNASLPFTVANDLDQKVTGLRLRVTAPNPRLEVRQGTSDPIEVAPGTRVRVEVPVRAIAAGRVSLTAQLLTPSGRELGAPVSVQVRTQPPGTWALWVVGAVVALVLLVGVVRAVRRPRHKVALEVADPTDGGAG